MKLSLPFDQYFDPPKNSVCIDVRLVDGISNHKAD